MARGQPRTSRTVGHEGPKPRYEMYRKAMPNKFYMGERRVQSPTPLHPKRHVSPHHIVDVADADLAVVHVRGEAAGGARVGLAAVRGEGLQPLHHELLQHLVRAAPARLPLQPPTAHGSGSRTEGSLLRAQRLQIGG